MLLKGTSLFEKYNPCFCYQFLGSFLILVTFISFLFFFLPETYFNGSSVTRETQLSFPNNFASRLDSSEKDSNKVILSENKNESIPNFLPSEREVEVPRELFKPREFVDNVFNVISEKIEPILRESMKTFEVAILSQNSKLENCANNRFEEQFHQNVPTSESRIIEYEQIFDNILTSVERENRTLMLEEQTNIEPLGRSELRNFITDDFQINIDATGKLTDVSNPLEKSEEEFLSSHAGTDNLFQAASFGANAFVERSEQDTVLNSSDNSLPGNSALLEVVKFYPSTLTEHSKLKVDSRMIENSSRFENFPGIDNKMRPVSDDSLKVEKFVLKVGEVSQTPKNSLLRFNDFPGTEQRIQLDPSSLVQADTLVSDMMVDCSEQETILGSPDRLLSDEDSQRSEKIVQPAAENSFQVETFLPKLLPEYSVKGTTQQTIQRTPEDSFLFEEYYKRDKITQPYLDFSLQVEKFVPSMMAEQSTISGTLVNLFQTEDFHETNKSEADSLWQVDKFSSDILTEYSKRESLLSNRSVDVYRTLMSSRYKNKGTEAEALIAIQMALRMKEKLNIDKAKKLFQYAMTLQPLHPEVLNHYGEFVENHENDIVTANHLYSKVLMVCPKHDRALTNRNRTMTLVDMKDRQELYRIDQKLIRLLSLNHNNSAMKRIKKEVYFLHIYHTLAIEGNTMSLAETRAVVETRTGVSGKSLMEHNEILGMESALRYVNNVLVKSKAELDVQDILQIHKRILGNADPIEAGTFRKSQVFVGEHVPPSPADVDWLMEEFVSWLQSKPMTRLHPVKKAALAHHKLTYIHPFLDGNGRTARLLMNLILMKAGYPPIIIRKQDRSVYYNTLQLANEGDVRPFVRFVAQCTECTLNVFLGVEVYDEACFKAVGSGVVGGSDVIAL